MPAAVLAVAFVASLLPLTAAGAQEVFDTEVVLWGKETAYSYNNTDPAPENEWVAFPPILAFGQVGNGRVVAGGINSTVRLSSRGSPNWRDNEGPVLIDVIFRWLSGKDNRAAIKVLWYEGYNVFTTIQKPNSYNQTPARALIDELVAMGYENANNVASDVEPLSSLDLAPYDVLVIPQLQPASPDALPESDVLAIKSFVEGGGGLLIMEQSDYRGFNFHEVQNKILAGLGLGVRFQHDAVYDDQNNWGANYRPVVDVDTTTWIGSEYQRLTGKTTMGLTGPCSLTGTEYQLPPYLVKALAPRVSAAVEPGKSASFTVTVLNAGKNPDDYTISAADEYNWDISLSESSFSLNSGESRSVDVTVTVPSTVTEKVLNAVTVTVSGASGKSASVVLRVTSSIPREEPPYPLVRENEYFYWFSTATLRVEPPAVPILCGTETGYSNDQSPREPWPLLYGKGEYPPVVAAYTLGQGRVIVDAGGPTFRSSPTDHYGNPLLAGSRLGPLMVRWLINWEDPREHSFLYYWAEGAFHTADKMSGWLYTIENELGFRLGLENGVTITPELLQGYDVLHILGTPRQFSASEIQAIKEWVEAGGGLLLAEQSDYREYSNPMYFNEILQGLGVPVTLQDDQLLDNDQNAKDPWYPRVYLLDPRSEDPVYDVWFPTHAFSTTMLETSKSGYGETVAFTLELTNMGTEDAVYRIELEEITRFGWSYSISPSENVRVASGEKVSVTITVTIPETENDQLAEWTVTVTDTEQDFLVSRHTIRAFAEAPEATPLPLDLIAAAVVVAGAAGAGFALSRRGRPKKRPRRAGRRARRKR
jgi:hypothetical protein